MTLTPEAKANLTNPAYVQVTNVKPNVVDFQIHLQEQPQGSLHLQRN